MLVGLLRYLHQTTSAKILCLEKAKSVADNINKSGGSALAVPGDVLKDDFIKEIVKQAAEFGGDNKIHIIVNNAGFTWDGVIHRVSAQQHDYDYLTIC